MHFFDFEDGDQGWQSRPATDAPDAPVWSRGTVDETKSTLGYQTGNAMPTKATSKGKNDGPNV